MWGFMSAQLLLGVLNMKTAGIVVRYLLTYYYSSQSKKLANARGIEEVLLSSTGKYCFTFNKEDESFTQWGLDPLVLEEAAGENRSLVEGRHVRDV